MVSCSKPPTTTDATATSIPTSQPNVSQRLSSAELVACLPEAVAGIGADRRVEDAATMAGDTYPGATANYGPIDENPPEKPAATLSFYDYTGGREQSGLVNFPYWLAAGDETAISDFGKSLAEYRRIVIVRGHPVHVVFRRKVGTGWWQTAVDGRVFIALRVQSMTEDRFLGSLEQLPFEQVHAALTKRQR